MKNFNQLNTRTRSNGIKYTIRPNRDKTFYPTEWFNFYDALKEFQKLTFAFLINTGARINEARHVQVKDIDLINNRIILRITKVRAKKGEKIPKPRIIPISSKFAKYLKNYIRTTNLKSDDYLKILSTPATNIAMKKSLQKARVNDWQMFSAHNIRKTLETWLLALDVDMVKVAKHMGHDLATAVKHYVAPDSFTFREKKEIREIVGDLYEKW